MAPLDAPPSPQPLPSELEYRAPGARRQVFSWPVFVAGVCLVLLIFGVFGIVFPRLETIYRDLGVWLPPQTQLLLDVAGFMQRRGLLLCTSLPLVLGFLVPFALGRRRSPVTRAGWWIVALATAVFVLTAALVLVIVVWVLPMSRLLSDFFR